MNFIPGAMPELVLFDSNGSEHDRISVEGKSVDEVKMLLQEHGFKETDWTQTAEL